MTSLCRPKRELAF